MQGQIWVLVYATAAFACIAPAASASSFPSSVFQDPNGRSTRTTTIARQHQLNLRESQVQPQVRIPRKFHRTSRSTSSSRSLKQDVNVNEEDYYMVDPPPNPRTPVKSGPIKFVDPALDPPKIPHRSKRNIPRPLPRSKQLLSPPPGCPSIACKSWPSSSSRP